MTNEITSKKVWTGQKTKADKFLKDFDKFMENADEFKEVFALESESGKKNWLKGKGTGAKNPVLETLQLIHDRIVTAFPEVTNGI